MVRHGALATLLATAAATAVAAPASATQTGPVTPVGSITFSPAGGSAVRMPPLPTTDVTSAAARHGCYFGKICGYEGQNYGGTYRYAFKGQYSNFQNLAGSCFSFDAGFTFNDCAQSVYNNYGSCDGGTWFWNAGFGGRDFNNNVFTGAAKLGKNSGQFSSVIPCYY